jgi:peptide deformylase
MLAKVFQHEIDHLRGTLIIDKFEQAWRLSSLVVVTLLHRVYNYSSSNPGVI